MNWYYPIESESDLYFEDSYSESEAEYLEYLEELRQWECYLNMDWTAPYLVEDDCTVWFNPNPEPEPEDDCLTLSFDELIPF